MTETDEKRRTLIERLGRRLGHAAPALALVASGAAMQAVADEPTAPAYTSGQEAPLMLAEAHAEGGAEAGAEGGAEAGAHDKEEAQGEAEGEAEGHAEGEGEGEAEGEAEGEGAN
ncbi:hypothetical protein RAN53_01550 [Halomonas sp. SSL-5]|uniref:hypothetical protein n=1 Tax=Halomonas sp. SSL-5 TaxID=3065855 RepID=UPI002739279C|nr:hypothetical protein [Halomonas sp. SSL-5]MDY7115024.1 hypothetical protein [Halomonas sp. SSL-5]